MRTSGCTKTVASRTGCAIILGESGLVFAKYAKQKKITKFSTEAELVGLSHTASQAIYLRNLIIAQRCDIRPAVVYQCADQAGRTGSERSRHINILHF